MRWFWQRRRVPAYVPPPPRRFVIHPTVDEAASFWQYTPPTEPPSNADIIKHGGEVWPSIETVDAEPRVVPRPDGTIAPWQLTLIPAWQLDGRVDIEAALAELRSELPAVSVLAAGARPANRGPVLRKPRVVVEHGLDVRNTSPLWEGTPIYASVVRDSGVDPMALSYWRADDDEDCQSYQ